MQELKAPDKKTDFIGKETNHIAGQAFNQTVTETMHHKIKKDKKRAKKTARQAEKSALRETPRLHFTEEERSAPELQKYLNKSEKANDRMDIKKGRIPKRKRIKAAHKFDEATGRAKVRLHFEETEKSQNGKSRHNLANRPLQGVNIALHGKIREVEKDNSGVEGAHKTEQATEQAAGYAKRKLKEGYRSHKLKPYREVAKAEAAVQKANTNYLYRKNLKDNPKIAGNPLSKMYQKQRIKLRYAKDLRGQAKAVGNTIKNTRKATGATKNTTNFAIRHWKGVLILLMFLFLLVLLFTGLSSCSVMLQGTLSSILGTSYTAEDEAIQEVEADYKELETGLREKIADIEADYPDYDEYQYHLDEIGHDPFALASFLTAKLDDYTRVEAQAVIQGLFKKQYTLTLQEEMQIRYRTVTTTSTDPVTGETTTDTEEVPYEYYILHVTLKNKDLSILAGELLTSEQKEMFDIYMETKGNKPDVFGDNIYTSTSGGEYTDYDIPPEALADERFAAMIAEAEKYLGYPYVWGGSNPSTSFDCSGFVCWVINQSGVGNIGRTTAQGIYNYCIPIAPGEAKPGDIIFFTGTYDSGSVVSHVGIYVGNGMMIHCGNPISYASVNTSYWQQHFYGYGRLP